MGAPSGRQTLEQWSQRAGLGKSPRKLLEECFPRIFAELRHQGVPLCLMTVQYLFRDYLSLSACQAARTDGALRTRLQNQGALLPIIDGLQFGNGDPVLYLIFDALSTQLLFGKEFLARSSDDLAPFIAQLKELGAEVRQTEEKLRGFERDLIHRQHKAQQAQEAAPAEKMFACLAR